MGPAEGPSSFCQEQIKLHQFKGTDMQCMVSSILKHNLFDLEQHFSVQASVFYLQWGCLLMTQWNSGLCKVIS